MTEIGAIYRNPTKEEEVSFVNLMKNRQTYDKETIKLIHTEENQSLTIEHIPFCRRCAKFDFEDSYKGLVEEVKRSGVESPSVKAKIEAMKSNLVQYKKADRFEARGEKPVSVTRLIDGIKTQDIDGYAFRYQCKVRGCGIDIKVPLKECDEYRAKVLVNYLPKTAKQTISNVKQ